MASNCDNCKFRKKAESNPRSFIGVLWRLHTYICPGWKSYKKELLKRNNIEE